MNALVKAQGSSSTLSAWWGRLGLQLKLQILIQGFLITILLGAQQWLSFNFERQGLKAAEDRTVAVADGAINGLNTLMATRLGGNFVISDAAARALFIQKMGASDKIRELRVIRGKGTNDEFGEGLPQEQPVDEMDRSVLSNGKMQFKMIKGANGEVSLRAVLPFIAMTNFRTSNCLNCHGVNEGSVLGAASVTVDIKDEMDLIKTIKTSIWLGQGALQILLFFVIRVITTAMTGRLKQAVEVSNRLSNGDLTVRIDVRSNDETGQLLQAMKTMVENLSQVVSDVNSGAQALAGASEEVSATAQSLSQASSEQAAGVEETSASIEQMTSSIAQNTENARITDGMASKAAKEAAEGGESVNATVAAMKRSPRRSASSTTLPTRPICWP